MLDQAEELAIQHGLKSYLWRVYLAKANCGAKRPADQLPTSYVSSNLRKARQILEENALGLNEHFTKIFWNDARHHVGIKGNPAQFSLPEHYRAT